MRKFSGVLVGVSLLTACTGSDEREDVPAPTSISSELAADSPAVVLPGGSFDSSTVPFSASSTGWFAQAGSLAARHTGTSLELTPFEPDYDLQDGAGPRTGDRLTLTTSRVSAGSTTLAVGTRAVATAAGGVAIAGAGFVETIDAHYTDVEQAWTFDNLPSGDGDLVITVAVGGEHYLGQTTTGLHFGSTSGALGFGYGNGRWVDATGAAIDIIPVWRDGAIELRVPRSVVDASAYPAQLDPTVGTEVAVDAPVAGSPSMGQFGDIAFSGAQYLAVWSDARNDSGDIYAGRLTTTGGILDSVSIKVAAGLGVQTRPRVATVNGVYLVVWENQATGAVEAATVTPATGAVTSLGTVATGASKPRIVARGTQALVIYQIGDDIAGNVFSGAFGPQLTIAATAALEHDPCVAADPAGNYFVAWSDGVTDATGTTKFNLKAQAVSPAGALAGAALDVAVGEGNHLVPSCSFIGSNYVVAWQRQYSGNYVFAARVTAVGTVLDTHTETVAGSPTPQTFGGAKLSSGRIEADPAIACTTSSCFLSYREGTTYPTTGFDIHGLLLDSSLTASGGEIVVSNAPRNQVKPSITAAGAGYFALWSDNRDVGINLKFVYGTRLSAAGAVLDPSGILIPRGNNREVWPTAARSSTSWLVDWGDSRVAGDNILGTRVSNAFAVSDSVAINVSNAAGMQTRPASATDPTTGNYLTVWSDRRTFATAQIYFARVPQSGGTLDSGGLRIGNGAGDQLVADIAVSTSGDALVVWQDARSRATSGFDVYGVIVDHSGTVLVPDFPIATAAGDQLRPRVGYDPTSDRFLVAWMDHRGADYDVYAARVTRAGSVLDSDGIALASTSFDESDPDLVFGSSRFLVVWNGHGDIQGKRVHVDGTAITSDDASALTICNNGYPQRSPRVAFTNNSARDFAVVWTDLRNQATTGQDIIGTMVLESSGALDGGEYIVANSTDDELLPVLSRPAHANGSNMEILTAYQHYSPADGAMRVRVRKLSYATSAPTLVSIAVTPANRTIALGQTQAYTATGTFSDGSTQNLTATATWASSLTSVATMTANTASSVGVGTTVISATQGGITGSTNLTVGPAVLVDISITPQDASIATGTSQQYQALGTFTDGSILDITTSVTWTSSTTTVATINASGLASAGVVGSTTIKAASGALSDTSTLTVAGISSIAIAPLDATVARSTTLQYTATATLTNGATQDVTAFATWTSSNPTIATITSPGGLATAGTTAGTTTIGASLGGRSASTTLTVTTATLVSIAITPTSPKVPKGFSIQLTATGTFSDGTTQDLTTQVTWTSSVTTVASISVTGRVNGKNVGTTTITAARLGVTGTTTLTVTNATLVSIAITPNPLTLAKGNTAQLTAIGTFNDGTTLDLTTQVGWKSSSKHTVSVNANGRVKATKSGTATITAKIGTVSGTDDVTVP